jgi:hypothetical protein
MSIAKLTLPSKNVLSSQPGPLVEEDGAEKGSDAQWTRRNSSSDLRKLLTAEERFGQDAVTNIHV